MKKHVVLSALLLGVGSMVSAQQSPAPRPVLAQADKPAGTGATATKPGATKPGATTPDATKPDVQELQVTNAAGAAEGKLNPAVFIGIGAAALALGGGGGGGGGGGAAPTGTK